MQNSMSSTRLNMNRVLILDEHAPHGTDTFVVMDDTDYDCLVDMMLRSMQADESVTAILRDDA